MRQVVFLLRQIDIKDYTNNTVVAKTADCFDAANDQNAADTLCMSWTCEQSNGDVKIGATVVWNRKKL